MKIAVYIMIVLLVVNLVVGVCFYVRTKKNDRNALSRLKKELDDLRAKNEVLMKAHADFHGVMIFAGDLIHGLYDLTNNKEIIDFLGMVGEWIRDFPSGCVFIDDEISKPHMMKKRDRAWDVVTARRGGSFPSLTMTDFECFVVFIDYWYKGLVRPGAMIEFCCQIACDCELKVGEAVRVVAANGDYDDLMQAVKEITGNEGQ